MTSGRLYLLLSLSTVGIISNIKQFVRKTCLKDDSFQMMNVPSWKGRVLFVPNVDAGAATHSPPLPLPSVLKLLMDHVSDKMKVTVRFTDTRVSATHRASTGDAVSAEAAKSAHPNSPRDPRHFPGCFAHFRWCHVTRTSCCMPPSSLLPGGCGKPRGYNVGGSLS